MRISTPYQFNSYLGNIHKSHAEYFQAQRQLATGKRFETAGEDPLSATLSLDARRLKGRFEQFEKNLRGAKDYLSHSEAVLGDVTNLARSAYTIALQGASDATSQSSREALAGQVADLRERLVSLANSQGSSGQYIFAGHDTANKPFSESGGVLTYSGDTGSIQVEVRSGEYMKANLQGAETMFTDVYDALTELEANLKSGNVGQLSDQSVADLKRLVDEVAVTRGGVGNRMQTIDLLSTENQRRIDDFSVQVSELEDIDFAETFVRYEEAQMAYQAALQVASQGMNLSLMDFVR